MKEAIDLAMEAFSGIGAVVFSGGECFLLKGDLRAAIEHAASRGLGVRCVTNGYWATSDSGVRHHLEPLIQAGLQELNLSTGDAHQAFVPWANIRRASIASAKAGLSTLIAIESTPSSHFTLAEAHADPLMREFMAESPARSRLAMIQSQWVEFDSTCHCQTQSRGSLRTGCDNLFDNIVFDPNGEVLACCGLTASEIPEMTLGKVGRTASELRALWLSQFEDFAKLWLWLDGPRQMLSDLASASGLPRPSLSAHPCDSCKAIFQLPEYRQALKSHYAKRVPDVLFRLSLREQLASPMPVRRVATTTG